MNAVGVWIFFPLAAGVLLLGVGERRLAAGVAAAISALLALTALLLPIEQPLSFFGRTFLLAGRWTFLGRQIILTDAARPWLVWFYTALLLGMVGAQWVEAAPRLPAAALVSLPLWIAAFSVEPFVYAVVFLFFGVLAWTPALTWHDPQAAEKVVRFITLQLLAVPFFLFVGWMLGGVEALPGQDVLAVRAGILTATGVAFLLGIFPFHVWYPALQGGERVYAAGMLLTLLPWAGLYLGLRFLDTYTWLREAPQTAAYLRSAGMTTFLAAGMLAVLETHLGRMWGYVLMAGTGAALLSIGMYPLHGAEYLAAEALPHLLAGVLGTFSLARLHMARGSLDFSALEGVARQFPFEAAGALSALFALAGYPLLAAFPVRVALWSACGALSLPWGIVYMAGMAGLAIAGLRTLAVLVMGKNDRAWRFPPWGARLFLLAGMVLLVWGGIFPRMVFPLLMSLARAFPQL